MAEQGEAGLISVGISNRKSTGSFIGVEAEVKDSSLVNKRAQRCWVGEEWGEAKEASEGSPYVGRHTPARKGAKPALSTISEILEVKMDVRLNLTDAQERLLRRINFIRRHYIHFHLTYIMLVVLAGTATLYNAEGELTLIDALFVAMSSVCCCGLSTVDTTSWSAGACVSLHVMMLAGGAVFTSAYQPLLRLCVLYKLGPIFSEDVKASTRESELRGAYRRKVERLWYASVVSLASTLFYVIFINLSLVLFLAMFNRSNLSIPQATLLGIASFHGAIFTPMEPYVNDPCVVVVASVGCALGFTIFPVLLRTFLHVEWLLFSGVKCIAANVRKVLVAREQVASPAVDNEEAPLLRRKHGPMENFSEGCRGAVGRGKWDRAFCDILASAQPASLHTFLFDVRETACLGGAWVFITLVVAAPFWFQQWDDGGLLAPYSEPYKVCLALCQAAIVRFGGASFMSCLDYSDSHIAIMIMAMYVAPIPVPTYRTHKKWKSVPLAYLLRPFTSRKFWLFVAVMCILIFEEQWPADVDGPRYDLITRTLFEVVSAFSGCGLSLPPRWSTVSFVGTLGTFSKLVIVAVMYVGRHYTVDFSIDIGFNSLS